MNVSNRIILTIAAITVAAYGCVDAPGRQQLSGSQEARDASQPFPTLNSALAAGDVLLGTIRGNGSSSGVALTANVLNTTSATLRLSTRLAPALYYRAATESAQNMLATQVYGADGRYLIIDQESVVEVPPGEPISIVFHAYCVDFEKSNPTSADSFSLAEMPSWLTPLAAGVSRYEESQSYDETAMRRAQIALWLAQGEDPEAIRTTFEASGADLAVAASLDFGGR